MVKIDTRIQNEFADMLSEEVVQFLNQLQQHGTKEDLAYCLYDLVVTTQLSCMNCIPDDKSIDELFAAARIDAKKRFAHFAAVLGVKPSDIPNLSKEQLQAKMTAAGVEPPKKPEPSELN